MNDENVLEPISHPEDETGAPHPMAADDGDPPRTAGQDRLLNAARDVWLIAENRVERLEKLDEEFQRLWFFLGGQWIPDEPPPPVTMASQRSPTQRARWKRRTGTDAS